MPFLRPLSAVVYLFGILWMKCFLSSVEGVPVVMDHSNLPTPFKYTFRSEKFEFGNGVDECEECEEAGGDEDQETTTQCDYQFNCEYEDYTDSDGDDDYVTEDYDEEYEEEEDEEEEEEDEEEEDYEEEEYYEEEEEDDEEVKEQEEEDNEIEDKKVSRVRRSPSSSKKVLTPSDLVEQLRGQVRAPRRRRPSITKNRHLPTIKRAGK